MTITFNVSSVLIGNGIIDPLTQIGAYRPMACGGGGYKRLLNELVCQDMLEQYQEFKRFEELCYKYGEILSCIYARRLGNEVGPHSTNLVLIRTILGKNALQTLLIVMLNRSQLIST